MARFEHDSSDRWVDRYKAHRGWGVLPERVRTNLKTAFQFLIEERFLQRSDGSRSTDPALDPDNWLSFVDCMDLSRPVEAVTLHPAEQIIAYRSPVKGGSVNGPLRLAGTFYTRAGEYRGDLGIDTHNRRFARYSVVAKAPALRSFTSAVSMWIDAGGLQYIIPHARTRLTPVYVSWAKEHERAR